MVMTSVITQISFLKFEHQNQKLSIKSNFRVNNIKLRVANLEQFESLFNLNIFNPNKTSIEVSLKLFNKANNLPAPSEIFPSIPISNQAEMSDIENCTVRVKCLTLQRTTALWYTSQE